MKKILFTFIFALVAIHSNAQKKTVMVDISHEADTAYTKVNPYLFDEYKILVEGNIGADLIINKDRELNNESLSNVDVLIIVSPLDRDRTLSKSNLTPLERKSVVDYVKRGGKLILFVDEEHRVNMESFGANDVVKPFGMEYGLDLEMIPDIGATSLITDAVKHEYELSYSGSRSITGGIPISMRNGEDPQVHGAYVKLDNGGTIVAFGETMTGIFMGEKEAVLKTGVKIVWKGKDDKAFMQELIEWLLN